MNIQEILNKKALFHKSNKWCNILSEEELFFLKEEIVKMNKKGISFIQISNSLGIERANIRKWMKSIGYKIINTQNSLKFRDNLFDNIQTEEDAYWLGFIYADGYIADKGQFEISLKDEDSDHLLKFANFCNFDKSKVKLKQKTNFDNCFRCRITFATQHLKERFNKLGIIPRKSLVLKYPKFLPENLERHFIRGYFDGDGCISLTKLKKEGVFAKNVSLLGTKEFLTDLLKSINLEKILSKKDKKTNNNTYTINFKRKEGLNFLKYMYKDSNIYLERKYKRYMQ